MAVDGWWGTRRRLGGPPTLIPDSQPTPDSSLKKRTTTTNRNARARQEELAAVGRGDYNFDHPDAFDTPLLLRVLEDLKAGRAAELPLYDFVAHRRSKETRRVRALFCCCTQQTAGGGGVGDMFGPGEGGQGESLGLSSPRSESPCCRPSRPTLQPALHR